MISLAHELFMSEYYTLTLTVVINLFGCDKFMFVFTEVEPHKASQLCQSLECDLLT